MQKYLKPMDESNQPNNLFHGRPIVRNIFAKDEQMIVLSLNEE